MILPDINLLVYAHNEGSRYHSAAKKWWLDLMNGGQPVGMCWAGVMGFIRIITHPGIQTNPTSVETAFAITGSWLARPHVYWLHPGERHYSLFRSLLLLVGAGGNLVTDAHLAALAVEHNCELHSNDTDFARFPGLKWNNPLSR